MAQTAANDQRDGFVATSSNSCTAATVFTQNVSTAPSDFYIISFIPSCLILA
jgi:hypothetical protein